jgi:coenzyme F420-reducing hydrogenase beta subunit
MSETNTTPPPMRTLAAVLAAIDDGVFHNDATDKLKALLADMSNHQQEFGGKVGGIMTINLGFTLDGGLVDVVAKVETKAPKKPNARTVMYLTPENNLSASNPKQRNLPFRDVTEPKGEVVAV